MLKHILRYIPTIKTETGLCKRISISFSGGRTSAVMTKWMLDEITFFSDYRIDVVVLFANTGCEHEETLQFVQKCNDAFNFNVVWLETVITQNERKGPRAKVVTLKTASRNGEPFEQVIAKHGIPNKGNPGCTTRLKEYVFDAYLRHHLNWNKGTYGTAIGIRNDEIDRISINRKKNKLIYPLIDIEYDLEKVLEVYNSWPFTLNLPGDHYGNCVWCWKKSARKLYTLAKNSPEVFDFPREMEKKYSHVQSRDVRRVFFRDHTSTTQLLHDAKTKVFQEYINNMPIKDELDLNGGCGESCEVYSDN